MLYMRGINLRMVLKTATALRKAEYMKEYCPFLCAFLLVDYVKGSGNNCCIHYLLVSQ